MIMIYTRFSADSRSSLTKTSAQPSPLLATCTFVIRTSRYCVCSWHKHGHTRRRKLGVHLQLQDEREGEKKGKDKSMEESMCCACVHMRAQKPNKSGHEYECNHTIEYTTFLPSNL